MPRKFAGALPEGDDVQVRADEVRADMWLLDPETGEWGSVKQAGIGNACVGFGGVRTWRVSLRKLGAREFGVDEFVTVRAGNDAVTAARAAAAVEERDDVPVQVAPVVPAVPGLVQVGEHVCCICGADPVYKSQGYLWCGEHASGCWYRTPVIGVPARSGA